MTDSTAAHASICSPWRKMVCMRADHSSLSSPICFSLSLFLYRHVLAPMPSCANPSSHERIHASALHDKLEQPWIASPWIVGSELSSSV